jgi:hypothetical protein
MRHCRHGGHEFADRRIEGNRARGAFGGAGVDPMRAQATPCSASGVATARAAFPLDL